jgi:hypothetical protein
MRQELLLYVSQVVMERTTHHRNFLFTSMRNTGPTFWDSFSEQLKDTMAKPIGWFGTFIFLKDSKNTQMAKLVIVRWDDQRKR